MTSALAVREEASITVTKDQLDLIRRTVAKDATPDELKLYLYDCQRQGVHPLDKLIHFTKRSGKYTPITSIDFMRIRAGETNEYAGSDAALFAGKDGVWSSLWVAAEPPLAALVTVWRLVQGVRCKFEAVARWSEYKPDANDFMWKKMPATMLSKCAEACALRKGFPRQLAGLYAKEELDQADEPKGYVVTAPKFAGVAQEKSTEPVTRRMDARGDAAQGNEPERLIRPDVVAETVPPAPSDEGPDLGVDLPAGARRILQVRAGKAGSKAEIVFNTNPPGDARPSYGTEAAFLCFKAPVVGLAEQLCQDGEGCFVEMKQSTSGNWRVENLTRIPKDYNPPSGIAQGEITDSDIPF